MALIVIIAFAVANRMPVDVGFAPFPITVELPLYGAFLLGLVVGVLIGGIGVWLGGMSSARRRAGCGARSGRSRTSSAASTAGGAGAGGALCPGAGGALGAGD